MTTENPWHGALMPFGEYGAGAKPDVAALAALLRSDVEIPKGARDVLAEIIDPILRGDLTVKWELRPLFTDRRTKTRGAMLAEQALRDELESAERRGKSITSTMDEAAEKVGVSARSAWTIWKSVLQPRRKREAEERHIREIVCEICPSTEAFWANPNFYITEAKRRLLQKSK